MMGSGGATTGSLRMLSVLACLAASLSTGCSDRPGNDEIVRAFWRHPEKAVAFDSDNSCVYEAESVKVREAGPMSNKHVWPVLFETSGRCTGRLERSGETWPESLRMVYGVYVTDFDSLEVTEIELCRGLEEIPEHLSAC